MEPQVEQNLNLESAEDSSIDDAEITMLESAGSPDLDSISRYLNLKPVPRASNQEH